MKKCSFNAFIWKCSIETLVQGLRANSAARIWGTLDQSTLSWDAILPSWADQNQRWLGVCTATTRVENHMAITSSAKRQRKFRDVSLNVVLNFGLKLRHSHNSIGGLRSNSEAYWSLQLCQHRSKSASPWRSTLLLWQCCYAHWSRHCRLHWKSQASEAGRVVVSLICLTQWS